MALVTIALTAANGSTGVWYMPADCTGTITVHAIGPGNGGGGGAYVRSTLTGITPGKKYYTNFLNDTWINTTNTSPTAGSSNTTGVKAAGGTYNTGVGGLASACAYNVLANSGGSGAPNYSDFLNSTGQGTGGAAGPDGPGGNGQATTTPGVTGGAGGSSNGHAVGFNGGAAGGGLGTKEVLFTDFVGNTYGPAGGAGAGGYTTSKMGNYYTYYSAVAFGGGGSAISSNGLIIIQYTPTQTALTNYREVITTTGTTVWRVPLGVTSVKVEAIGGGGAGNVVSANINGSGGGGAYAATNSISVIPGTFAYISVAPQQIADGTANRIANQASWFNTTNALPTGTTSTTGVKAAGGYNGTNMVFSGGIYTNNGLASQSTGDIIYDGGSGEIVYSNVSAYHGPGGGGAAGPGGPGKRGGKDTLTGATGAGGGGGGAGGTNSVVGANAVTTTGGAGGAGPGGVSTSTGGVGATTTTVSTSGTNGGGGGGGAGITGSGTGPVSYRKGSAGSTYVYWTNSAGETFGPGGGGGGSGGTTIYSGVAGNGGTYGGGGGAASAYNNYVASIQGIGAQGIVVLTYSVPAPTATAYKNNFFLMF